MDGGAVADGFFGQSGLSADAAGDFGEFAGIGADGGEVVCLADEVECAQGFPDLLVARVHRGDFGSGGHTLPGATEMVRMRPLMGERSSVVCWPSSSFATKPP